jgi:hypothetical protein
VPWTSVSNMKVLVFDSMLANCWAWIHAVDVIDAAANGIDFDDADAHDESGESFAANV